jgi:maleylacetoacetate isomerase
VSRVTLVLHSMWRATAPYRVRIGLNLKGLPFDYVPVDLPGGEQRGEAYRGGVNRQGLTPALRTDDSTLTQSLAILEWLEETHPRPPILPKDRLDRAIVRSMALTIACDIHPLNNLRVLQALSGLGVAAGSPRQRDWIHGWMREGFDALEPRVAEHGRGFAFGDAPTIADCCLVPQVYSAERYAFDLSPYPAILAAVDHARAHPAFAAAHPDRQPDARP